ARRTAPGGRDRRRRAAGPGPAGPIWAGVARPDGDPAAGTSPGGGAAATVARQRPGTRRRSCGRALRPVLLRGCRVRLTGRPGVDRTRLRVGWDAHLVCRAVPGCTPISGEADRQD